jgi:hypothetical protein
LHLHGRKALTTTEIMVFYLDGDGSGCRTFALPTTLPGLAWRRFQGFQYAVAERHQSSVTAYVRAHARKALRVEATGPIGIGENPISSENGNPPQGNGHPELVTVYRLKGLPLPLPRPAGVGTCQRDRPI